MLPPVWPWLNRCKRWKQRRISSHRCLWLWAARRLIEIHPGPPAAVSLRHRRIWRRFGCGYPGLQQLLPQRMILKALATLHAVSSQQHGARREGKPRAAGCPRQSVTVFWGKVSNFPTLSY